MTSTVKHTPIPERLYKFNPAGYCGVFMPEKVMKKLVKMTDKFEREVRLVLSENKDSLYEYGWSLAYPNGKQTTVLFADKGDVDSRIKLFCVDQPEYCPIVYAGTGHDEASKEVIKQIEQEATGEQS